MVKRQLERSPSEEESASGDESSAKVSHITRTSPTTSRNKPIRCLLPPHNPLSFSSREAFETHYHHQHSNRCHECHRNLPTAHFLGLHISENHDPFVKARKARDEKTYACFVEGCDKVCRTWQKRRSHLVDKHGYPRNYDYFIVNDGVDRRRSMLRTDRRRSSKQNQASGSQNPAAGSISAGKTTLEDFPESPQSTRAAQKALKVNNPNESSDQDEEDLSDEDEDEISTPVSPTSLATSQSTAETIMTPSSSSTQAATAPQEVDDLTKSMSALKFVPRSLKFGRGRGKGGLARR